MYMAEDYSMYTRIYSTLAKEVKLYIKITQPPRYNPVA